MDENDHTSGCETVDSIRNRRLPMLGGLGLFVGATAMVWQGRHIAVFCVGRLLQGLATAIVWTAGLALLADTVGRDGLSSKMGYVKYSLSLAVYTLDLY